MGMPPRFSKLYAEARTSIQEVSADDVAARLARGEAIEIVDVREESEFARGRIKGARHLAKGILERDIENAIPDVDTAIVLYCAAGPRSALAALSLQKMGYRNVVSMAGGWREWTSKSLPTEG